MCTLTMQVSIALDSQGRVTASSMHSKIATIQAVMASLPASVETALTKLAAKSSGKHKTLQLQLQNAKKTKSKRMAPKILSAYSNRSLKDILTKHSESDCELHFVLLLQGKQVDLADLVDEQQAGQLAPIEEGAEDQPVAAEKAEPAAPSAQPHKRGASQRVTRQKASQRAEHSSPAKAGVSTRGKASDVSAPHARTQRGASPTVSHPGWDDADDEGEDEEPAAAAGATRHKPSGSQRKRGVPHMQPSPVQKVLSAIYVRPLGCLNHLNIASKRNV
jgi:hypothetical protein